LSPGTPASSINKSGRHDIAELLLKVALKHKKIKKSNHIDQVFFFFVTKLVSEIKT
jgi:hypothetical protein